MKGNQFGTGSPRYDKRVTAQQILDEDNSGTINWQEWLKAAWKFGVYPLIFIAIFFLLNEARKE